jgi:cytochrome c oxidase subunit 3
MDATGNTKGDYAGSKLGMWIFLFTEMLLFGGLFLLYSVFRSKFPLDFHNASSELSRPIGTINTLVLLTSSLTMVLSLNEMKKDNKRLSFYLQGITALLGIIFLINKFFEWGDKIGEGMYPDSPLLLDQGKGETIFFGLYYLMTGIHGVHVAAGIIVIIVMMFMTNKKKINSGNFIRLENSGLYWHLVDIVWVFLFPIFYLINR